MTTITAIYNINNNDDPSNVAQETRKFSDKDDFDSMNSSVLSMKNNTLDDVSVIYREYGSFFYEWYFKMYKEDFKSFAKAVEDFDGSLEELVNNISDTVYLTGQRWFLEYVVEHSAFPLIENIEVLELGETIDPEAYDYYDGWQSSVGEYFTQKKDLRVLEEAVGVPVSEGIIGFLDVGTIGGILCEKYGYNYNGSGIIFRYVEG